MLDTGESVISPFVAAEMFFFNTSINSTFVLTVAGEPGAGAGGAGGAAPRPAAAGCWAMTADPAIRREAARIDNCARMIFLSGPAKAGRYVPKA